MCYELSTDAKKNSNGPGATNLTERSDEEIDAGFAFIQKEAKDLNGVRLLLWQTKALKNDTPIKGWPIALTREITRLIVTEGTLGRRPNGHSL